METVIKDTPEELGKAAGKFTAQLIKDAISKNGQAHIILATGTSQFETLKQLISDQDIMWNKVTMFHLDEYVGLPETSPASFRKYLQERFLEKVPPLKAHYLINGEVNPKKECSRLGNLIEQHAIDVALVGIGENGHLAFNDPPADFDTAQPYHVVVLDDQCRKQQFSEGWFSSIEEVPEKAISMSVQQIMKSKNIVCSVPDRRKANAIKDCLKRPVSKAFPASILQNHAHCICFLDKESASLLSGGNDIE